ncbi:hypothetical protein HOY80DRAFT_541511 [Tuber brumale]|nr:hypothetical protein HOY80DRAFT_541511 [Tuber brumale]
MNLAFRGWLRCLNARSIAPSGDSKGAMINGIFAAAVRTPTTSRSTPRKSRSHIPLAFNPAVVELEFHPNPTDRTVKPYLITDQNVKFVWGEPVTFPVFIPSIAEFFDLCLNYMGGRTYLDDDTCLIPQIDMDNLARYLVLDSPTQQEKLLSQVKNTKHLTEYFADRQWWQERRMKRVMERQAKLDACSKPGPQVLFFTPSL